MRPYFLDASVITKLVIQEKGSKEIQALCRTPSVIRTSWLSLAETYGVIKRRWRREKWQKNVYFRKLFALQYNVQRRIKLDGAVNLDDKDFRVVENILNQYKIDFSDALHIVMLKSGFYAALAGESKPVLVASDKRLLQVAKSEGIVVWNPEREPFLEMSL
jgi:predicted nucleic acid-binding protein